MYFTMLALSSATKPASKPDALRTYATVSYFAVGAIVGWPFALLLAVPFVLEELFVAGGDRVSWGAYIAFLRYRWLRLLSAGLVAGLIFVSSFRLG
jgi:alpha-1,2-mannosyltransferase